MRGSRPWQQLARLLERLPTSSHYKAALADDDELAELLGDVEPQQQSVPIAGYDPVVSRLDSLFDAVNLLRETFIASKQGKNGAPPQPVRAPRPETALERKRWQERMDKLQALEDQLLGRG